MNGVAKQLGRDWPLGGCGQGRGGEGREGSVGFPSRLLAQKQLPSREAGVAGLQQGEFTTLCANLLSDAPT